MPEYDDNLLHYFLAQKFGPKIQGLAFAHDAKRKQDSNWVMGVFWPLAAISTLKCYTPPKIGHFWKNHIMPDWLEITGGLTFKHKLGKMDIF